MYLSVNWLKKFLPDFELHNLDFLKNKLDTRLSEVESIESKGELLDKLVVAKIIKVVEHPTNKKLTVCTVDTGEQKQRTIVCGAPNAAEGLFTIACLPGGSVINSDTGEKLSITERKMGEVTSEGMLCAPDELGMSDDHSRIIELPSNSTVGKSVTEMFRDVVIQIENKALPHRPDAFSHLGIAREMSAILKLSLKLDSADINLESLGDNNQLPLEVEVQVPDLCPRFSALVVDNIRVEPSPLWLQIALSYAGVRPINNIVDITNYVMLNIGQPMHAFDYHKLAEKKLITRMAKKGEIVRTLDGKERELSSDMVVVAAGKQAESIAGIMGGAATEIDSTTKTIVLEAANWEMYQIRRASRNLGLRSEASGRFEKGISPSLTTSAIEEAVVLIKDLVGGEQASQLVDIYLQPEQPRTITFDLNSVKRLTGTEIEKSKLIDILEGLGITVKGAEKIPADAIYRSELATEIELIIPNYRRDLRIKEDVVEEVARLYGYEHISPTLPSRSLKPPVNSRHLATSRKANKLLVGAGLTEVLTYSMVGADLYKKCLLNAEQLIKIPAPISPELAFVRDQILPSLLSKVKINTAKYSQFGLFELSRVALSKYGSDKLPVQPFKLAILVLGDSDQDAFRQAKHYLEVLAQGLGLTGKKGLTSDNRSAASQLEYLHPGKTADIQLAGAKIGEVGVLHPLAIENLDLEGLHLAGLELNFDQLVQAEPKRVIYRSVSTQPAVRRDLSFWTKATSRVGEFMQSCLEEGNTSYVESAFLIDTYTAESQSSVTIRFVLQALDHTLEQTEIQSELDRISSLADDFDLVPRD